MGNQVSIITPCYNSEKFLTQTIESVLSQTYQDWEMLIVDDCSTDSSAQIIEKYSKTDSRIKYLKTETRSGSPTQPRNIGIANAKGRYIAFLDSDDLWLPNKLKEQMKVFMSCNDASIVFSYYEKISEDGNRSNRIVKSPPSVTYSDLLYGNVIGCLTGVYDTHKVGKVYMKDCGHEDYIMWLEVLRKGGLAVNTNSVQALYRVRGNSVSSNKLKALNWQWNIYTKVEGISVLKSVWYFLNYACRAFVKSLK